MLNRVSSLIYVLATMGAWVDVGVAAVGDDINLNSPIVACYLAQSAIVGTLKCDPPSTLVGAVYGRCDREEQAIRNEILNGDVGFDKQIVADIAIRHIHDRMGSVIQSWILGAQTGGPACPKADIGAPSK